MATILVVDDQPTGRQFLVTLLGYQGHRILEAVNGVEALERVQSEKPDLIITDLMMPQMDGYEFAFRLRADPTVARMPIIFYSAGYDVIEAYNLALACGVFHMLPKPSDPEIILSYVEAALQFQVPSLPSDGTDASEEKEWAEEIQTQHHQLLVSKLTSQVILLEQEIAVRKQAEAAVHVLNVELEARVAERTTSLNKANARMRGEISQNQRAQRKIEAQAKQIEEHCKELTSQKSQLTHTNAMLQQMASTDGLTGLSNRRTFQTCLEVEFARGGRYDAPLSLLLLDVDQFKQYNDAFGHLAGDAALRQVASLLEQTVRLPDIAARYGGEEFAVILPNTGKEGALATAERLRKTIEAAPWQHRSITVSIGIASLTSEVISHVQIVQEADMALYAAKEAGRNRVRHHADLAHVIPTSFHYATVSNSANLPSAV